MDDRPMPIESFTVERMHVQVYATRGDLGVAAAREVAARMRALLARQERVRMVFAAAASQRELLAELGALAGIAWPRVIAFHMDEYVGLGPDAPQSFARFLREHLFDRVRPGVVHYLDGRGDPAGECERYTRLLSEGPIDIVCAGIGENGHLAFNDPPVADLADPKTVKVVALDRRSREQQVHDGCFGRLEEVPTHALTLTIPALMGGGHISCVVPGPTKAEAVRVALQGPVSTDCPASVLRRHPDSILYLDRESAALLAGQ